MSGLLAIEAPFVRILLEGVQDGETEGLLTTDDVVEAADAADIATADVTHPEGYLYIALGHGATTVTEVTLRREPGGWAVTDVRRTAVNGPRGLLRPAPRFVPVGQAA